MSRTYRKGDDGYRNSDDQVNDMIAARKQREQNRKEWNRRSKAFADIGDYDRAEANLAQARRCAS